MVEYINQKNAISKIKMLCMNLVYEHTVYGNFNYHYFAAVEIFASYRFNTFKLIRG
jgi:hypothetical protein